MKPGDTRPYAGGTITCYNAAKAGEEVVLRYYAKFEKPHPETPRIVSWDSRATEQEAEADLDLHKAGKPVPYVQQAVVNMVTQQEA